MNMVYGYLYEKTRFGQPGSILIRGRLNCMAFLIEGKHRLLSSIGANMTEGVDMLNIGRHSRRRV